MPQVADFGTVRQDVRGRINSDLDTDVTGNQKTHASTQNVIGTRAYMPSEYLFGRVSTKTDTFSYGIVLVELLTSLNGRGARTLLEFSEGPFAEELCTHPTALQLGWPKKILADLAGVAARCSQVVAKARSAISEEVSALETALADAEA